MSYAALITDSSVPDVPSAFILFTLNFPRYPSIIAANESAHQGPHWTTAAVRATLNLSPSAVCTHYWCDPASAFLVMATTLPQDTA